MDWREKHIDDQNARDPARCKADYAEAVADGRRNLIQWQDVAASATVVLPEWEAEGRRLIEQRLGYLPHECHYLPPEPFIRGLLHTHHQGLMTEDKFRQETDEQVKLIRNSDMQHNTCLTYDEAIYRTYAKYVAAYGHAAKERLTRFLVYEPLLEHSLIAELWLQEILARDDCRLPPSITEVDVKAMTLIKYREVLLK